MKAQWYRVRRGHAEWRALVIGGRIVTGPGGSIDIGEPWDEMRRAWLALGWTIEELPEVE